MTVKTATEIVNEIRDNFFDVTGIGQHVDKEKQTIEIQKLLDKGIDVEIVNKPIIEQGDEKIKLSTYKITGGLEIPENTRKAFIWMWWKEVPPEVGAEKFPFGTVVLKEEVEIIRMKYI
jgi:hypothetical protein